MADLSMIPQEIESVPNGIFLKVEGICDVTSEDMLKDELEKLVKGGYARFIIDLEGLKFLNSNGFAQLVALADKLKQIGGKLVLNTVPKDILEMSHFLGLSEFFAFSENYNHGVAILLGVKPASSSRTAMNFKVNTSHSGRNASVKTSPAPSPEEVQKKKATQKVQSGKNASSGNLRSINRFAVAKFNQFVSLNKHYPIKVIICKEEDLARVREYNSDAIFDKNEIVIPARNPYVTIVPRFSGCKLNPVHTNVDLSMGTIEYTFWTQPSVPEIIGDASIQIWYGNDILTEIKSSLNLDEI